MKLTTKIKNGAINTNCYSAFYEIQKGLPSKKPEIIKKIANILKVTKVQVKEAALYEEYIKFIANVEWKQMRRKFNKKIKDRYPLNLNKKFLSKELILKRCEILKRMTNFPYSEYEFTHKKLKKGISERCDKKTDWNYYSKSYKYPKIWKTYYFELDIKKNCRIQDIKYKDNILTIKEAQKHNIPNTNIIITRDICLIRKKGGVELKTFYVAECNKTYYHSEKIEKSIKGLQKKLKKITINTITKDTEITTNDYAKLTGACIAGIKEFMIKHNITNSKMKIKDILNLENDFYGKSKILKALVI